MDGDIIHHSKTIFREIQTNKSLNTNASISRQLHPISQHLTSNLSKEETQADKNATPRLRRRYGPYVKMDGGVIDHSQTIFREIQTNKSLERRNPSG